MSSNASSDSGPGLAPAIIFSEKIIREAGTGRLSIINSFQRFTGPTIPFAVPPFVVTVSLAGFSGEQKHKLSVELLSPAGAIVIPAINAEVGTEAKVEVRDVFEFSFGLPPVQFEEAGVYEIVLKIGDQIAARRALPVVVLQAPASPAADAPGSSTKK
jgi:hypothetical protein